MSFEVAVGTIPGSITEFKGHSAKMGDPALVIRHPSGPWTISQYSWPLVGDPHVENVQSFSVGGVAIQVGETTVKGTTVQPDNSFVEWERPSLAYYPDSLDSYGDGATEKDTNAALYLFPRHGGK